MRACLLVVILTACGVEHVWVPDPAPPVDEPPPGPTWYADIGPIIHARCTGCHQPGAIAPFSLIDIDDVHAEIGRMVTEIDGGIMPPFYADAEPDCTQTRPWRDDPRMTSAERALLGEWIEAGMPAGDVRELAPPPPTDLQGITQTLSPLAPFTTSGDRDQFICYAFDPQVASTRYITAMQVRPGLPAMVHHADLAIVGARDAAALIAVHPLGLPFSCNLAPGQSLHNWAPGNQPLTLPQGVAIPLEPGALITIQYHYHPAGIGGVDSSLIDLALTDEPPLLLYRNVGFGNAGGSPHLLPGDDDPPTGPAFQIPAGSTDHVETQVFTIDPSQNGARFVEITPHAHMLATHIRATIDRRSGVRDCLATGRWNFDWQRTFGYGGPLDQLPVLEFGDVITVTCHYDNSWTNPNMPRLLHDLNLVAPTMVSLGNSTTDEMCMVSVGIAFQNSLGPAGVTTVR